MKTQIEPFKIKAVEPIAITTREQREQYLKEASYNAFALRSDHVTIDLLTDSGTTAMSSKQWAALMDGDESYAGSVSYYKFENEVKKITGFKYILPTHQGRAAERVLFTALGVQGKFIPNNTHFDTTRGNIEFNHGNAVDLLNETGKHPEIVADFKGNMDVEKLEAFIKEKGAENIPVVMITVTNNGGGGQPVSMKNIKDVRAVCDKYGLPLYIDCCRFAENCYFIKHREKGYENKTILEIAQEMFSYADGATMSCKKDGLSNSGGFVATNNDKVAEAAKTVLIVTEGFLTYGGLTRRDLEALAVGFREVLDENYLHYRIGQVKYLGDKLQEGGVPILVPTGGHGVFIDARAFLPHIPSTQFPAQSLCNEIYLEGGVRTVEIGSLMFGPNTMMELVRLAIPRRVYTQNHMDYVAEACINVYKRRDSIKGLKIVWEAPLLRHFTAKLAPVD